MSAEVLEKADGVGMEGAEAGERVVLRSAPLPEQVPGRVLIAPWGSVNSSNGSFVMDDEAAEAVLEAFARHGTDLPVDYEHQSLGGAYAAPSGQAPAAGWIRALEAVRPGEGEAGLYARVEWTEGGRARVAAREYRYLSPVVLVRKTDRRVLAVHSVALTNKPAIVGMRPIVNSAADAHGVSGRVSTGCAEGSGPPAREAASDVVELLRMKLGLPADIAPDALLSAACVRIGELGEKLALREAQERVRAAFQAGKLSGAQQEWAMRLALDDPARFDAWMESAPVVVSMGLTQPPSSHHGSAQRSAGTIAASARAAYRAAPALAMITSEAAWVEECLREAGVVEQA